MARPSPAMCTPRATQFAATIQSGPNAEKILIAGGEKIRCDQYHHWDFVPLRSTELCNPATNSCEPGPEVHGAATSGAIVQIPVAPRKSR